MLEFAFLLSSGSLSGGAKVVLEHAERLSKLPFVEFTVFVRENYPSWFSNCFCEVMKVDFSSLDLSGFDAVLLTCPDQLDVLEKWKGKVPLLHFCQGYEGDVLKEAGMNEFWDLVNAFYQIECPRLVVNQYLKHRLSRVTRDEIYVVGQPLPFGFPLKRPRFRKKKRILVVGNYLYPFKGVRDALEVASFVKERFGLELVRVSPVDTRSLERVYPIDRYFVGVPPERMPELYAESLISIYLSRNEGFGLPVLESLACGTPVVARDIPPVRETCGDGYPLVDDIEGALGLAERLCMDEEFYDMLVEVGYKRLRRFSPYRVTLRLLAVLLWSRLRFSGTE